MTAKEAFQRLKEGNGRFASSKQRTQARAVHENLASLAEAQHPFATILGCSDSRVPAKLIFDQGFGDLFVIRVAGNIVAPSQVGSVEFASAQFGTNLVVVLGHSRCGAIAATYDYLRKPKTGMSQNINSIVERIRPAMEPLMQTNLKDDADAMVKEGVRANVRASANHLRHASPVLERLRDEIGLVIVGAEYSLETGIVDFFDGVPDGW